MSEYGEAIYVDFTRGRKVRTPSAMCVTQRQRNIDRRNAKVHAKEGREGVSLPQFQESRLALTAMRQAIEDGNELVLVGLHERIAQIQDTHSAQQRQILAELTGVNVDAAIASTNSEAVA